jgi:hypothetical protein
VVVAAVERPTRDCDEHWGRSSLLTPGGGIGKLRSKEQLDNGLPNSPVQCGAVPAIGQRRIGTRVEQEVRRIGLVQYRCGNERRHTNTGFTRQIASRMFTSRLEWAPSGIRVSAVPQQQGDDVAAMSESPSELLDGFLKRKAIALMRPASSRIGARIEQCPDNIGCIEHDRVVEWQGAVGQPAGDRFPSLCGGDEGNQINVVHVTDCSRDRRAACRTRRDRIATFVPLPPQRHRFRKRFGRTRKHQRREHHTAGCYAHWIRLDTELCREAGCLVTT